MDIESVTKISINLPNPIYKGNLQATEELIFLFDRILKKKPENQKNISKHIILTSSRSETGPN